MTQIGLYLQTLRHLRWTQILYRFKPRIILSRLVQLPAPLCSTVIGEWCVPAKRTQSMVSNDEFFFLNVKRSVKTDSDWNNPAWDKLWLFNLHYFYDLTAVGAEQRKVWHKVLMQRWIDHSPVGYGNGWAPYPLSLRIVNWIKWAHDGNRLENSWRHSLAVQARYLSKNLELHLLGNHLFANAKALCFAGLFFDGFEAEGWYKTGLKLIEREIVEQLHNDGGNFELSTMYHIIFLEDLLDLINIHRAYGRASPMGVENNIIPMLNWLHAMCHPDGEISFFNDAALGVAPSVAEITNYAKRLGFTTKPVKDGLVDLPSSGYSRIKKGKVVALIDRASVGPDYLPGHAHADTLSFELSLFGKRTVVNSGTSVYGTGVQRQIERGTASHSSVIIDDQNSSEVWGGFRVARRAYVIERVQKESDQSLFLAGCHCGYKRLKGKPKHCREWLIEDRSLRIVDRITGNGFHQAIAVFPLHPDVGLQNVQLHQCDLVVDDHLVGVKFEGGGELEVVEGSYHPEFGLSIVNQHLHYKVKTYLPIEITTRMSW